MNIEPQINNLLYFTYSNKPRCRSLTSHNTQCKNAAKFKCDITGNIIFCGIHHNSYCKQVKQSKPVKQSKQVKQVKQVKQTKQSKPVNKLSDTLYTNTYKNTIYNSYRFTTRISKIAYKHIYATIIQSRWARYCTYKNIKASKIQSTWFMYKEKRYMKVFNNGINSSSDVSILTLEPIRQLKDAFIFYRELDGSKRWYMESISSMYNWYKIYKTSIKNTPTPHPNMKCVYTQEELSTDEHKYIVNVFDKVILYKTNKWIKNKIIDIPVSSLYETILDKSYKTFTDSTDSVYIDTFMRMPYDAVFRLITECSKILNYNTIHNVFKTNQQHINNIKFKKYSSQMLYTLYTDGSIKLKNQPNNLNLSYFQSHHKKIEDDYKTLLIKDYFITEIMDKSETNDMLMYYIRSNNIWFYSVSGLFFEDAPENDSLVCDFNLLGTLNTYYNNSIIR